MGRSIRFTSEEPTRVDANTYVSSMDRKIITMRSIINKYPGNTTSFLGKKMKISHSYACNIISEMERRGEKLNVKRNGNLLSENEKERRRKRADRGESLGKMGSELGISLEGVRRSLISLGVYDKWKSKRALVKSSTVTKEVRTDGRDEKRAKNKIVASMMLGKMAHEVGRLEEDGVDVRAEKSLITALGNYSRRQKYGLKTILSVFERYHFAKDNGYVLNYRELGDPEGLHFTVVRDMLQKAELPPMVTRKSVSLNKWQKKSVAKASNAGFSMGDIAYFLDIPADAISSIARENRNGNETPCGVSYSTMSQVYEASDLGYEIEEIQELLGRNRRSVVVALNNRKRVEKSIGDALNALFPRREKRTRPYLS